MEYLLDGLQLAGEKDRITSILSSLSPQVVDCVARLRVGQTGAYAPARVADLRSRIAVCP